MHGASSLREPAGRYRPVAASYASADNLFPIPRSTCIRIYCAESDTRHVLATNGVLSINAGADVEREMNHYLDAIQSMA